MYGHNNWFDAAAGIIWTISFIYLCFQYCYEYWWRKNLPYLPPRIPLGNAPNPLTEKRHFGFVLKSYYDTMKAKSYRHFGLYFWLIPVYVPIGLNHIKNILTNEFQHFTDRGCYYDELNDPLSAHLFAVGGPTWKHLKQKLNPTFTPDKIKNMFPILLQCATYLEQAINKAKSPLNINEISACFTTDVIGSCVFGLNYNSLTHPESQFRKYGKKIFTITNYKTILYSMASNFPNLGKMLGYTVNDKDTIDFFMKTVKSTIEYRIRNRVIRNDFLQLMMGLMESDEARSHHDGRILTLEEVTAQCFVFFAAGFKPSSATIAFALFELARHQDIQEKVRLEIRETLRRHHGKITYEAVRDMKYTNQVIDETLRLYPPLSYLTRACVRDYQIPNTEIVIARGTKVLISILGIHYDGQYYKDPEVFDPDRFSTINKSKRHPYTHIPFGEGPRMCIGMQFGLMQTKVGLMVLLKDHRFTINEKTCLPIEFDPNEFVLGAKGDIWLDINKIV